MGSGDGSWGVVATMGLSAVVLQQGINEQQFLANKTTPVDRSLQAAVNREAFRRLEGYFERYCDAAEEEQRRRQQRRDQAARQQQQQQQPRWSESKEAREMRYEFDQLKRTLAESRAEKNVHLVLHGALLCRLFTGAHATCCKSGKDRTSMGVTLEETRMLCDELRVVGGRKACKNIRRFGVRRDNVRLNTGQTKYAFNHTQTKFLPICFRPPGGTHGGGVVT